MFAKSCIDYISKCISRKASTLTVTKSGINVEPQSTLNFSKIQHGPKIVSIKSKNDLSRIVILLNAGSRFEDENQRGLSHVLRHCLFNSNKYHTILTNTRSLYHIGSETNIEATRDHIIIKISCGSRYLFNVLDYIGSALSFPCSYYHETSYALQSCLIDYDNLKYNLIQQNVFDELHFKLFRTGYGNSLFVQNNCESTIREFHVKQYMNQRITNSNCVLGVSSDLSHKFIEEYVSECFQIPETVQTDNNQVKVHSGESIIHSNYRYSHMALGYAAPSINDKKWAAYTVLQKYLSICDEILTSTNSVSRLRKLLSEIEPDAKPSAFYLPYDYSGVFGFYLIGQTKRFRECIQNMCKAIKTVFTENIDNECLNRAINQAKLDYACYITDTHNLLTTTAAHTLYHSQIPDINSKIDELNAITKNDIKKILDELCMLKPVIVIQGNQSCLPSADEIYQSIKK